MNVSHYVRRFSEAGQNLLAMHGAGSAWYRPDNRHFRFHRELDANARAVILSVQVGAGEYSGQILHVMQDADRGFISATCLDCGAAASLAGLPLTKGGPPAKAKPRSIAAGRFEPADVGKLLAERLATVAHRNRVQPSECGGDGLMAHGDMVGRFFASASHLWSYAGFDARWFAENGYGGAAVEMKLTIHEEATALQDYAIVSWVPRITNKMLPLSNQIVSVPENRPLASISATSIIMDHKTRMVVDIPDDVRKRHASRFDEIRELVVF